MITARSQLNHGSGHGSVTAQSRLAMTILVTVSSHGGQFFFSWGTPLPGHSGLGYLQPDTSVWEWAPMSIGKNQQITGLFVVTNFPAMILFQSKFHFFMHIRIIHVISKKFMWINVKKWTVHKKYMNYFSKWVTLTPTDQCQVPIIRFVPNTC